CRERLRERQGAIRAWSSRRPRLRRLNGDLDARPLDHQPDAAKPALAGTGIEQAEMKPAAGGDSNRRQLLLDSVACTVVFHRLPIRELSQRRSFVSGFSSSTSQRVPSDLSITLPSSSNVMQAAYSPASKTR